MATIYMIALIALVMKSTALSLNCDNGTMHVSRVKRQFGGFPGTINVNSGNIFGVSPLGGYCPDEQVPYINPSNNVAQGCPRGFGCPQGYTCQISSTQQYLCCAFAGQCPAGQTIYRDSGNRPVSCGSISFDMGLCPSPSRCQQAVGGPPSQYLCCLATGQCPLGATPFINQGSNSPQACTIGGSNFCPLNYNCQVSTTGASVCCPFNGGGLGPITGSSLLCPAGLSPYTVGTQVQECTPGTLSACFIGSSCLQASNDPTRYLCCTTGSSTLQPVCPTGYTPNFFNSQPQACTIGVFGACQSPYSCVQSPNRVNTYLCCRPTTTTGDMCPAGQQPLTVGGNLQYCSTLGSQCAQVGYTCQFSVLGGQRLCCGFGFGSGPIGGTLQCASGRIAYQLGQNTFTCTLQAQNCPLGYTCEPSIFPSQFICCQSTTPGGSFAQCQNGQQPYMIGGQVQFCTPGVATCIAGYACLSTSTGGQFVCCPSTSSQQGTCPNGQLPASSISCTPGVFSNCPLSTTCATTSTGTPACCASSTSTQDTCPNLGQVINPLQTCTLGTIQTGCPPNSDCFRLQSGFNRCCSTTTIGSTCPNNGQLLQPALNCALGSPITGCPLGYDCLLLTTGAAQCCSTSTTVSDCPNGGTVLQSVVSCTIGSPIGCPINNVCLRLNSGQSRCCSTTTASQCPNGGNLVSTTNCVVGGTLGCALGAQCFLLATGQTGCCSSSTSSQCPNGGTLVSTTNCVVGSTFSCASGAQCLQLSTGQTGCCSSTSSTGQCPNGGQIVISVPSCQLGASFQCPVNSECFQVSQGQSRCCTSSISVDQCDTGQQPFIQNGVPLTCTAGFSNCPVGYVCSPSSSGFQNLCCQSARCPGGLTIGTNPQQCRASSDCPGGFGCQQASNLPGTFICCPTRFADGTPITGREGLNLVLQSMNDYPNAKDAMRNSSNMLSVNNQINNSRNRTAFG